MNTSTALPVPAGIELALRTARTALETRWPRGIDADSHRDHHAITLVDAALKAIKAHQEAVTPLPMGEAIQAEVASIRVGMDVIAREVTLWFPSSVQGNGELKATLALSSHSARELGIALISSGMTLDLETLREGGAS